MSTMRMKNWLTGGRRRAVVAAVLTALLLPAVPASAITFLTPWSIRRVARGVRKAGVKRSTWATGTRLIVNMRRIKKKNAGLGRYSRVLARRWFRIGAGGERISFTHAFETLLQNTRIVVRAVVRGYGPNATRFVRLRPITTAAVGPRPRTVNVFDNLTRRLRPGRYHIRILIQYRDIHNMGKSFWDNKRPRPGSPHAFTIQAV